MGGTGVLLECWWRAGGVLDGANFNGQRRETQVLRFALNRRGNNGVGQGIEGLLTVVSSGFDAHGQKPDSLRRGQGIIHSNLAHVDQGAATAHTIKAKVMSLPSAER